MLQPPSTPEKARQILAGHPPATIEAAVEFLTTRSVESLDKMVFGIVAFHLPHSENHHRDLSQLPGSTRLVADLSFDSLSIVEVNFLFTDLLGVNMTDEELQTLVTLDDLRRIVRHHLGIDSAT